MEFITGGRGGWECLADDLLVLILDKLISKADYVRFSAVCKPWLSVAKNQKLRLAKMYEDKQQLPMLLIPKASGKRSLYSLNGKIYDRFQLQMPYNNMKRYCGSSHGWLASVEKNLSIKLINPFTGKRISLPRCFPKSDYLPPPNMNAPYNYEFKRDYKVRKVILSTNPSLYPDDFMVLAICDFDGLMILKYGDESWTPVNGQRGPFSDAINYKGKFYVVDYYGVVFLINHKSKLERNKSKLIARATKLIVEPLDYAHFNCHPSPVPVPIPMLDHVRAAVPMLGHVPVPMFIAPVFIPAPVRVPMFGNVPVPVPPMFAAPMFVVPAPVPDCVFRPRTYICESSDGGLLLVKRQLVTLDEPIFQQVTKNFEVFKLIQFASGQSKAWVRARSLGSDSLFLGDNHSISVSALNYSNCWPNCIYFTDDFIDRDNVMMPYDIFGPCGMGVFHLENGSINTHYTLAPNNSIKVPPAVWILPTLRGNLVA